MDLKFKSLTTRNEIDLIPYIKDFLSKNSNTSIFIGSDSQNTRNTTFATVIVLHNTRKGGHILYVKDIVPLIRDRFSR
jgi:predicted RNase H-related nuclease YkuK (DUF458 family)